MPLRALVALLFLFYRGDLNSFEEKLFSQIEVMSSLSKNHEGIFSSLCLFVCFSLSGHEGKKEKRKKKLLISSELIIPLTPPCFSVKKQKRIWLAVRVLFCLQVQTAVGI